MFGLLLFSLSSVFCPKCLSLSCILHHNGPFLAFHVYEKVKFKNLCHVLGINIHIYQCSSGKNKQSNLTHGHVVKVEDVLYNVYPVLHCG